RYNYDMVHYKSNKEKVTIICKEHGEFFQQPSNHLNGQGCPYCAKNKSLIETKEDFIKSAISIHGDKYIYEYSLFKNLKSAVKIICKEHGVFKQTPSQHLKGRGCNKCAIDKVRKHN